MIYIYIYILSESVVLQKALEISNSPTFLTLFNNKISVALTTVNYIPSFL
jgi:hypothetical protein